MDGVCVCVLVVLFVKYRCIYIIIFLLYLSFPYITSHTYTEVAPVEADKVPIGRGGWSYNGAAGGRKDEVVGGAVAGE
jgi:hypothetical protein